MSTPQIQMYVKGGCPYCVSAQRLLKSKGVDWQEISLLSEPGRREEMIQRSGRRTVPQIFIGETHVGGFDDLQLLEEDGKLDRLLKG